MPLLVETRDNVGILTLSRPDARNAWDEDYNSGLFETLNRFEADSDIRCVILTGDESGGAFCAGANLAKSATHSAESAGDFIEGLPRWRHFVVNMLADFPKPVIAAVNGYAIGIGCIATYSCDLIVASTKAEWRSPQINLGILPAYGALSRLARWVGKGHAMKAGMGYPISAEEAFRTGLAQWLVPHEDLMTEALAIARTIAAKPPLAARMVKDSVIRGMDIPNAKDASELDTYRFQILAGTEDAKEAHAAWREKRSPVFRGR